jgi:phosphatidate cytidylyltransferase
VGEPDSSSTPAPTSRAGRNLPAAIASGVALGAIVAITLFTYKWTFAVVVIAALLIALYEFARTFALSGIRITRTPVYSAPRSRCRLPQQYGGRPGNWRPPAS